MNCNNADCRFGYRDSIFKHELKNKVMIVSVVFKLTKKHICMTEYAACERRTESTWNK